MLSANSIKLLQIRLKNTSANELIYRIKELLMMWNLKSKFYHNKREILSPPRLVFLKSVKIPKLQCNVTGEHIEELLTGRCNFHNSDPSILEKFETKMAGKFFANIDWRSAAMDIRTIWEPARLQNITTLLAYLSANPGSQISEKIKGFCANHILGWIQKNPFLQGPHYISVMECGLRIPVLLYSLKLLDNLNKQQRKLILYTIFLHAWWIGKRLSLYSSLGNHTIAESVGLVFAGSFFADLKDSKKWFDIGIQLLEKELPHQIAEDGGPAEQSFQYHRFVLDLYWLVINFLEINNLHNCHKLKSRLIRAENFLWIFQEQNGQLPSIGDSDDGFAIAPRVKPQKPAVNCSRKKIRIFKNSGYTVITTEKKAQLTFDHGPLGMPPLYNHGHADALSITLRKYGKQILVDPGTYKYNSAPEWRRYFKGTRAHNTITIDGCDQSVQETGFIWSHPYRAELLGFSENAKHFCINAMHDGYKRLEEPVRHKRNILFFDESCFLIKDSFVGTGVHDFEINFHLHPNAELIKQDSWWQINNEGARIYMQPLENGDFLVIRGLMDPIHGWYSPRYGAKLKCNVMSCKKRGFTHEISFMTAICTEALIDTEKVQDKLIYFD
jgi:hypothetical protein